MATIKSSKRIIIFQKDFLISSDKKGKVIRESKHRTLRIKKVKNYFTIFERPSRKEEYIQISNIRARKKETVDNFINRIDKEKIMIPYESKDITFTSTNKLSTTQTINRQANINNQLIAIVKVTDLKKSISEEYIGFSSKIRKHKNKSWQLSINNALEECKIDAMIKFLQNNFKKYKNADPYTIDIPDNIEAEIISYKFLSHELIKNEK